jgi:hypothetical protein
VALVRSGEALLGVSVRSFTELGTNRQRQLHLCVVIII